MELDSIALMLIMVVAIGVSIGIILSVSSDAIGSPGDKIKSVFNDVSNSIMPGKSYDICQDFNNKQISLSNFELLLQAISRGQCAAKSTTVQLTFSLTRPDIANITKSLNLSNKGENVFYRQDIDNLGIGAVIIKGNPGEHPLKMWDQVQIDYRGTPDKDIILKVTDEGCDPYDQNCESMCSYMPDICDPLCYRDGQKEDVTCDIDCVDADRDGNMTGSDRDGVCDGDCYTNTFAPDRAYDVDCVWKSKDIFDNICNPNSNGVQDGVCDPDCAANKTICDPDCNGLESEGNPKGLLSSACYVCDKACDGFCSLACTMEDKDPDCPDGFKGFNNLTECCGNGKCSGDENENCQKCSVDCPGAGTTCEDLGKICCPSSATFAGDIYGCAPNSRLPENSSCSCSSQCDQALNLTCNGGRCCPAGYMWSVAEKKCVNKADVLIVALKANMKKVYSDAQISQLEAKIEQYRSSLSKDGLGSMYIYLDEDNTSQITPGGIKVASPSDWRNIDSVLDALIPKVNASYLVIIGGYSRFPQPEFATGACDDPYYSAFQSDDPYGDSISPKNNVPDIPIGRIPDPNNGDMNVMMNALDTYIALHNSGGLDLSDYASLNMQRAFDGCQCASSGTCLNKNVFGISNSDPRVLSDSSSYTALSGHKLVHILMHGGAGSPQVFSHDPCGGSFVMQSTQVPNLNVGNAVWLVMSCYSAQIKNKASTAGSTPMQFLTHGGAVYFGGTLTQMGGRFNCNNCPAYGDNYVGALYQLALKNFSPGARIGDAYLKGKRTYLSGAVPDPDSCNFRQGHENLLYGDPTLKIKAMPSGFKPN